MPGQGPVIDEYTVFSWPMNAPLQTQTYPIVDEAGTNNINLNVIVFEDNHPWIVAGEVTGEYARYSNGVRRFFHVAAGATYSTLFQSNWTVEFRCKFDQLPAAGQSAHLFAVNGADDSSSTNDQMRLRINEFGQLTTFWEHGSGTNVDLVFTNSIPPIGSWTTIQARGVWSGANLTVHMYVDGTLTDSLTATGPTGGTGSLRFGLFGVVTSVAGGGAGAIMRGAISSFHFANTDLGHTAVVTRSILRKFTAVASTWGLHTFPQVPSELDAANRFHGMSPAPFTDLPAASPNRAYLIVCDGGYSKSFKSGTNQYLMMAPAKDIEDCLLGEYTFSFWIRLHQGFTADRGIFEWYATGTDTDAANNTLLRVTLESNAGGYRPRIYYEHGTGVGVSVTGANIINDTDGDPQSARLVQFISLVARNNAGTREFDIYSNGVFQYTIVASSMPTGGSGANFITIGRHGSGSPAAADLQYPTLVAQARSPGEILQDYERGLLECDPDCPECPECPEDAVPPTVIFTPASGTEIQRTQHVQIDVQDNGGEFCRIFIVARFANGDEDVIWDGAQFAPKYISSSGVVSILNGFRFTVLKSGGWPGTPNIRVIPIDAFGNETGA